MSEPPKEDAELADFLRRLILAFQEEETVPDDSIYDDVSTLHVPTQAHAISMPQVSARLAGILIRHSQDRPNGEVKAVSVEDLRSLAALADTADQYFGLPAEPDPPLPGFKLLGARYPRGASLAMSLARHVKHYAGWLPSPLRSPFEPRQRTGIGPAPGDAIWLAYYQPPLPEDASAVLPALRSQRPPPQTEAAPASGAAPQTVPIAFGAHSYPRLVFGMPRPPAPSAHVIGGPALMTWPLSPVFVGNVGGVPVRAYEDGQIVAETGNQSRAENTVNLVFGVLARSGVRATAARTHELTAITSFSETGSIGASSGLVGPRNPWPPWNLEWGGAGPTQVVDPSALESIVQAADQCAKDRTKREEALRLLVAGSAVHGGQHTEGFVMAWTVIESVLQQEFSAYWEARGRSKTAMKEMTNDWRVSQIIDLLSTARRLSDENAAFLHRLRKIRNKIVHDLADAEEAEASECLTVATHLVGLPSVEPPLKPQMRLV